MVVVGGRERLYRGGVSMDLEETEETIALPGEGQILLATNLHNKVDFK